MKTDYRVMMHVRGMTTVTVARNLSYGRAQNYALRIANEEIDGTDYKYLIAETFSQASIYIFSNNISPPVFGTSVEWINENVRMTIKVSSLSSS